MVNSDDDSGQVIELASRSAYKPDLPALARNQLRQARETLGHTRAEFADLLTLLLGWNATAEIVESWETTSVPPGDVLVATGLIARGNALPTPRDGRTTDPVTWLLGNRFADVTAVYATRSEFIAAMPPHALFDQARDIRVAGLSLNIICQQYPNHRVRDLARAGTQLRCLFLDPAAEATKAREQEEHYPPGHLAALTELNIQTLCSRVRDQLAPEDRDRLQIATYDETVRLNLTLIDNELCIMQPYLPETRGVDSPTFLIQRREPTVGLYLVFDQVFEALWERGTPR